jgi:hypothetical protein
MFSGFTMVNLIAHATICAGELATVLLVVGGIVLAYGLGNWIYSKVKAARA